MGDLGYFLLLAVVTFQFILLTRLLHRLRMGQIHTSNRLNDIMVILTGMANGASPQQISDMFKHINEQIEEAVKFEEIANKARPPWWRRMLTRAPRIND